jgi:hypothetical protein
MTGKNKEGRPPAAKHGSTVQYILYLLYFKLSPSTAASGQAREAR